MSDKTANNVEMVANQQAYNTDGAKDENENYIVDENNQRVHVGGAQYITVAEDGSNELVDSVIDLKTDETTSKTLIRTDVDSHQEFKTPNLQNQEGGSNEIGYKGSSLNITAYNVYEGDGSKATKPSSVVVGVAGSSGQKDIPWGIGDDTKNSQDWLQNTDVGLNRSGYNGWKNDEALRRHKAEVSKREAPLIQYELEVREKVDSLKKYRQNNIPITLVGDSKGGEDAAYLALRFVDSTQPKPNRVDSNDNTDYRDYSAVSLYLTNPKGIRVSDEDYKILEKMAQEGKITIEIVYPEVVSDGYSAGGVKFQSDGSGKGDGRVIPGKRIYTVPNGLNTEENHTISNYEKDVYQGPYNNYKFQCDEKPESFKKYVKTTLGDTVQLGGYRYKVSRITDRSGKTISVTDYFFEEQKDLLNTAIIEKLNALLKKLDDFKQEDILTYFTEKARSIHVSLEDKHKAIIKAATPFSTFKSDHKDRFDGEKDPDLIEAINKELETEYNNALTAHVESEGVYYPSAVSGVVSSYITKYQETIAEREKYLLSELERVRQVISSIEKSKVEYKNSQKEIQLIIEKNY